uniref:Uncharacterized protein n=1 Tax=Nelumbo nucifera TaxID=4432 RepID=A0A822ZRY7_NELNU|nr:TPA_asm: hypothetical protein HUJ06_004541 [Nelumbo nucifera]
MDLVWDGWREQYELLSSYFAERDVAPRSVSMAVWRVAAVASQFRQQKWKAEGQGSEREMGKERGRGRKQ